MSIFAFFDNLDPQYLIQKSEKDYYQQVQIHHKNQDNYDNIIRYNFTAFTKAQHTNKQNSESTWPKWLRGIKLIFHIYVNDYKSLTDNARHKASLRTVPT